MKHVELSEFECRIIKAALNHMYHEVVPKWYMKRDDDYSDLVDLVKDILILKNKFEDQK